MQCVLLATVVAAVSCMVESRHSSERIPCLRTCILCRIPGTFPLSLLSPSKVSGAQQL